LRLLRNVLGLLRRLRGRVLGRLLLRRLVVNRRLRLLRRDLPFLRLSRILVLLL
jgi:hypothetical protein